MKPKVIAWSNGLTVIPFENVLCVTESDDVDGQLIVSINNKKSSGGLSIRKEDAILFIEQFNTYLAAVEGLQIQVQDDDIPLAQEELKL